MPEPTIGFDYCAQQKEWQRRQASTRAVGELMTACLLLGFAYWLL